VSDSTLVKAAAINGALGIFVRVEADSLKITGTTGAIQAPSLTTAQRDALTAEHGMIIYNSTTSTMQAYSNSAWINMGALG
tara:strand:+ start:1705 stop:1947 length:243 start_codon:yes stop_codon:yes gene_type:complete